MRQCFHSPRKKIITNLRASFSDKKGWEVSLDCSSRSSPCPQPTGLSTLITVSRFWWSVLPKCRAGLMRYSHLKRLLDYGPFDFSEISTMDFLIIYYAFMHVFFCTGTIYWYHGPGSIRSLPPRNLLQNHCRDLHTLHQCGRHWFNLWGAQNCQEPGPMAAPQSGKWWTIAVVAQTLAQQHVA